MVTSNLTFQESSPGCKPDGPPRLGHGGRTWLFLPNPSDVDVVGEPIEQSAGEPLGSEDFGPSGPA